MLQVQVVWLHLFNVVISGGASNSSVTIYHGGKGFAVGNTITIHLISIGNGGNLVLTVGPLENNNGSNMLLLNNATNITQFTFKGMTGTPVGGQLAALLHLWALVVQLQLFSLYSKLTSINVRNWY